MNYFVRNERYEEPPKASSFLQTKDMRTDKKDEEAVNYSALEKKIWAHYKEMSVQKLEPATTAQPSSAPAANNGIAGMIQKMNAKSTNPSPMNTIRVSKPKE